MDIAMERIVADALETLPDASPVTPCRVLRLGMVDYLDAWRLQRQLAETRAAEGGDDVLLLLEHPPTYTLGVTTHKTNLLVSREELESRGVKVIEVDRGGDITYHGPGQLVGYPVMDISKRRGGPLRYLRDLEQVLIRALGAMGVAAERLRPFTGVWVGGEKIAAIGVKVNARKITSHGFALNVCPDLQAFALIVPCGIEGKAVTSLDKVLGRKVPMEGVMDAIVSAFGEVFERVMRNAAASQDGS
jgi:lipoyl(octanoyl) transferase